MNKHYNLLSTVKLPTHDGDESATYISLYDIDDEKYDFLCCVRSYLRNDGTYGPNNPAPEDVKDASSIEDVILNDLGLTTETYPVPGALYYMYDAYMNGRCVVVAETRAYNV